MWMDLCILVLFLFYVRWFLGVRCSGKVRFFLYKVVLFFMVVVFLVWCLWFFFF